jgi:hypothetical protein
MSAIAGKREFLCEVAGGIEVFMNRTYLSDEIHTGQDEDIEVYIKNNILDGSSFCDEKFCKAMQTIDDETLRDLLYYFEDRDMSMVEVYNESCLGLDDLPPELTDIAEAILDQDIITFTDFLEY